ncbi:hypothetical protein ONZ45_g14143 [Pleurotus djamor]|nr:hypothetical protein ONZ45_g14143 [Pleurotus djamor]
MPSHVPRDDNSRVASRLMNWLNYWMGHLLSRKLPFRDIVFQLAEVQRRLLELTGCINYWQARDGTDSRPHEIPPLKSEYMGAFTEDPDVAEVLYSYGIPVWLVRAIDQWSPSTVIKDIVNLTPLPAVVKSHVQPTLVAFCGDSWDDEKLWSILVSFPCEYMESRAEFAVHFLHDMEFDPVKSLRDTPHDILTMWPPPQLHACHPTPVSRWTRALEKFLRRQRPPSEGTYSVEKGMELCLPDPLSFFQLRGHSTSFHPIRVYTWLRFRQSILTSVGALAPHTMPSLALNTEQWSDALSSINHACRRSRQILSESHFLALEPMMKMYSRSFGVPLRVPPTKVTFDSHTITPENLPPNEILRGITWELCEASFRLELQIADKQLAVQYQPYCLYMVAACFPSFDGEATGGDIQTVAYRHANKGLSCSVASVRYDFVVALAALLRGWKGAPVDKLCVPPVERPTASQMKQLETACIDFYVESFYTCFKRVPSVPHHT